MKNLIAAIALTLAVSSPAFAASRSPATKAIKSEILKAVNAQNPSFKGSIETVRLGKSAGDIVHFTSTENLLWGGAYATKGTFNTSTKKIVTDSTHETN